MAPQPAASCITARRNELNYALHGNEFPSGD
jgi:hypothetical protein